MSRVPVRANVLMWAIERSGSTMEKIQKDFPKIREWISGEKLPTLKQLEDFAKKTRTPFGFLFLDEPPEERLPIPHFRTLGDEEPLKPSPDLMETIYMMQLRQAWMRDYLIAEGQKPLAFANSMKIEDSPIAVAERMRNALGFQEGWARRQPTWADSLIEFRDAIEHSGALVFFNGIVGNNTSRKLDPGEFRGFVLADEYAPLVFVNNADSKAAQMFTLAHEMAHVIFGSSAAFDLRQMQPAKDATEQACNRAAAEFLVPERELLEAWPSLKNQPDRFHTCARRFKVSEIVVARRALDLNLIRKQEFFDFYNNHKNLMKLVNSKKSSGGDFYNTQNFRLGRRFVSAVARAAKEGKMLYSEAYHLTGLHGKTFDSYVSKTVIGGAW